MKVERIPSGIDVRPWNPEHLDAPEACRVSPWIDVVPYEARHTPPTARCRTCGEPFARHGWIGSPVGVTGVLVHPGQWVIAEADGPVVLDHETFTTRYHFV